MIAIREILNDALKRIDTGHFIKCPLCREEWNRLRPCSYIQDGRTIGTYVCVTCAESIQSIEKVFNLMGLSDVAIHEKQRRQPYRDMVRTYGDKFDNPRAFKCKVENAVPIVTAEIEAEDTRLLFTHIEGKASTRFDNIFQCASYFKNLIEKIQKEPREVKKGWGNQREDVE